MKIYMPVSLHRPLPIAVALGLLYSTPSLAGFVGEGQTETISAGSPIESWVVQGTANFNPGSAAQQILIDAGGVANLDGTAVTSSAIAIGAVDGELHVTGSNVTSTNDWGISLTTEGDGSGPGNLATITSSSVSGVGRGINATSGTDLTLTNSQVIGIGTGAGSSDPFEGGIGIAIVGSTVTATGSTITGSNNGIAMSSDSFIDSNHPSLVLDGSSVNGLAGAAIVVSDPTTEASILVSNGTTLSGGNGNILEVVANANADFTVDSSTLTGNILVDDTAHADVTLANNSTLTGQMTHVGDLAIDSTSAWNMTASSNVQNLSMSGGTVNLGGSSASGFHELTLESLSGSGTFALGTDLATVTGDHLNVTGNASGDYQLAIANTGVEPAKGAGDLQVVHTGSGDAAFSVIGGQVDVGTFTYLLEKQGNDWYLVQQGGGSPVSPSASVAIGLFNAAPTVWYGELATLRSRMGEIRNGEKNGGFWMRGYGNKFNMTAGGGVEYSQTQSGMSFGADLPVPNSNGLWLVGLMGGYSNSDLDMKLGSNGQIDSYYLGAYSTWREESGFYIDALIKANRFQNSAKVRMSDGVRSKGDYNSNGIGASVEVGKHIALSDGWFVEPYGQMSTLWTTGESYGLDNGLRASSNQADSYLGKVGSHLGRTFPMAHGGFIQPYVKAAVAHEFAHANKVKINDNSFSNDLSGSRAEMGAGLAVQLTDVLQVHADFDYSKGENIEQPWGVNVGVRYNF